MAVPDRQRVVSEGSYDDAGLFRSAIVQVVVWVTPEMRTTREGDLVLRGFVDKNEIEVVFPGQRRSQASDLMRHLQQQLRLSRQDEVRRGRLMSTETVRQKLRIDGTWRVRLLAEINGMPVRRFQFVAARWRLRDERGIDHIYGHLPS